MCQIDTPKSESELIVSVHYVGILVVLPCPIMMCCCAILENCCYIVGICNCILFSTLQIKEHLCQYTPFNYLDDFYCPGSSRKNWTTWNKFSTMYKSLTLSSYLIILHTIYLCHPHITSCHPHTFKQHKLCTLQHHCSRLLKRFNALLLNSNIWIAKFTRE